MINKKEKYIFNAFDSNLDEELFFNITENAIGYDCMMGYFNSSSLKVLAKSLLYYLKSDINHRMRLIVSPNLSIKDIKQLIDLYEGKLTASKVFEGFVISEETLTTKTIEALSYLIAENRLEIKIAIPKHGLFHSKCWILPQNDGNEVIISGSSNHTESGLSRNFEYLTVDATNFGDRSNQICKKIRGDFNLLWENTYPNVLCGSLSLDMLHFLVSNIDETRVTKQSKQNIISILEEQLQKEDGDMTDSDDIEALENLLSQYKPADLNIPDWLEYEKGDYAHQGKAIEAWFDNGKSGILSIATGGGKTLTSLTAGTLLSKKLDCLLVVIAVPTVALMNQWTEEVALFGLDAINTNLLSSKKNKKDAINNYCRKLKFKSSKVEAVILSHDSLKSDMMNVLEKYAKNIPMLLIADEVHNLGSEGFKATPPEFFQYKLGLSATPVRQYDDEGTAFLLEYFNDVIYEFTLKEAIGLCLVHFDYFVHIVYLTAEEEDDFYEITQKIKKMSFAVDAGKESDEFKQWSRLCIQRRRLIETAVKKIDMFKSIIRDNISNLRYSLVFCSDKQPEQLDIVNAYLNANKVAYHQITSAETSNSKLLNQTVSDYNEGIIEVLTSKRVLDEGFNVPQTRTAYILASNTTKKQWTQRLGRVLRKAKGKEKAVIHDFVVLPIDTGNNIDSEFIGLLKSESERIKFFVEYATNGTEQNGSISVLGKIADLLNTK